jgi:hypothetical protein
MLSANSFKGKRGYIFGRHPWRYVVYAFGRILERRGAEVAVVILTPDAQGNECGLDNTQMCPFLRLGASPGTVQSKPGCF